MNSPNVFPKDIWPEFGKAIPVPDPFPGKQESRLRLLYRTHFDPRLEEALSIHHHTDTLLLPAGNGSVSHPLKKPN